MGDRSWSCLRFHRSPDSTPKRGDSSVGRAISRVVPARASEWRSMTANVSRRSEIAPTISLAAFIKLWRRPPPSRLPTSRWDAPSREPPDRTFLPVGKSADRNFFSPSFRSEEQDGAFTASDSLPMGADLR